MVIQYAHALHTYVAADRYGVVHSIYRPEVHGTLEDFRRAVAEEGT